MQVKKIVFNVNRNCYESNRYFDSKLINIKNDSVDVFVKAENRYNYKLSFRKPKNIQCLMDQE